MHENLILYFLDVTVTGKMTLTHFIAHEGYFDFGILVVCDFALVFALAPISPLFCHFFALALALYFTLS